ncbi:MAG: hypothetical protein AAF670_17595 [Planctomycetota bacterium]
MSRTWCLAIAVALCLSAATSRVGKTNEPETSNDRAGASEPTPDSVERIGILGRYRIGQWTAVDVRGFKDGPDGSPAIAQLETVDGDQAPVVFQQPVDASTGLMVPGREAAPLLIRDPQGSSDAWRLPPAGAPNKEPAMIPEGMPWVLVFGDSLGIESIGANELLNRESAIAVTAIRDARSLPDRSLGLMGVDLIVVTSSGQSVLRDLTQTQRTALHRWLIGGGTVLTCLGQDSEEILTAADWLAKALPRTVSLAGTVKLDPAGFESFTNSQTRLPPLEGIELPKTTGRQAVGETLIAGRTTRRVSASLAARYSAGLGEVRIIAADLESAGFADWPERLDLVRRVVGGVLKDDRNEPDGNSRQSGYSDLAGQVRRTLDQFDLKRAVSFSIVALVIGALITLVAPLDYYLVQRVLGRPLLGWMTFPFVAILISVALIVAAQPRRITSDQGSAVADELARLNSMEFLDLDMATGFGRLFRWGFLYSHPSRQVNVSARPTEMLDRITKELRYRLVAPFGFPGRSMGGIQIETSVSPSTVAIRRQSPDAGAAMLSDIESLSLAPRSSKSLAVTMQLQHQLQAPPMRMRPGTELLQGSLSNPLPTDLLDGMLIYRNWVYLLPTRFPAGGVIQDIDTLRQKNFRWQLSRQRALESSSEGEVWDVTTRDQPRRLAEVLMFHDAAGGSRYTTLQHHVLGNLDFSDLLNGDRCVLVGRVADRWTQFSLDGSTDVLKGNSLSMVRVVLPVRPIGFIPTPRD